jgi:hypothetical protein
VSEMASCRACRFMSENLMVYVVPAKTVPVGVRVRLPAFVHAPVAFNTPGSVFTDNVELLSVIEPVIPWNTILVAVSMLKDEMQFW